MQRALIGLVLVAAGYVLGAMRAPAQADDSSRDMGKIVDVLKEIARSEDGQADALKQIARSAEKCAR